MKFHGITMKGEYKSQTVIDASALPAPSGDATQTRRLVYDQTTNLLWIADSSQWKIVAGNGDIPKDTEMWVFANTAPSPGWIIDTTPSDDLLAVGAGGGGTYNVAAQTIAPGSFTLPLHQHNMNNHKHTVAGSTGGTPFGSAERGDGSNDLVDHNHTHTYSLLSTVPNSPLTSSGGDEDYRPEAAVGIICRKL